MGVHVCVLGVGPGSVQELRMGHLWSSVGHHRAGSQGMESLGPSQEGSYKGSVVSGGRRSAQSRILAPQAASWAVSPLF